MYHSSVVTICTTKFRSQNLCDLPTYLLTPWCRFLLRKLTGLQLVKKFPAFHGIRRFITALTSVHHLSLSWASPIQSIYPHLTSWRSILILSTHLRLGLPSGLLPSGFPSKTLYIPHYSPIRATCQRHLICPYCAFVFCVYLRTAFISIYKFHNGDWVCLLRGKNWDFKYNSV